MTELAQAAYAAEKGTDARSGVRDATFPAYARAFDSARYLRALRARGFRWLPRSDPRFPPLLAAIHDPPAGLFLRGSSQPELLSRPAVAVVGARACSAYGAQVARMLGRELTRSGLVVVSGLARGIDGEAHRGALEAGGATVAVLGCGIDRDYPAAHAELARQIVTEGLVIAEYAPGVEPAPWRFPARNRIIAGLCALTIVVEARERSGALITADFALEERDGPDGDRCEGVLHLGQVLLLGVAPVAEVTIHAGRQEPIAADQVGRIAVQVEIGEGALRLPDDDVLEGEHHANRGSIGVDQQVVAGDFLQGGLRVSKTAILLGAKSLVAAVDELLLRPDAVAEGAGVVHLVPGSKRRVTAVVAPSVAREGGRDRLGAGHGRGHASPKTSARSLSPRPEQHTRSTSESAGCRA